MKKPPLKSLADLPPLTPFQKQLAEAFQGVPPPTLTAEDVNRLAAIDEEKHTEGRIHRRPDRTNPHD